MAYPNPQAGPVLGLAVELEHDADALVLELYSPAYTLELRQELRGPFRAGWNRLRVDAPGPAPGLHFAVVHAVLDVGVDLKGAPLRLYRLP